MTKEKKKMANRLMVCLRYKARQGKSSTIKALAEKLMPKPEKAAAQWYLPESPPGDWSELSWDSDICVTVNIKGKRTGLNSAGDVAEEIVEQLKFLADKNCSIIFCACRSKGDTVKAVEKMANKFNYTLIWTAPYTNHKQPPGMKPEEWQDYLNRKKAEHLEDFIG